MATKKTKKSKDLQYIDGKNQQLEKDKESLSRLEIALAVKEKRNPFQSDTSEDFENKLKTNDINRNAVNGCSLWSFSFWKQDYIKK